MSLLKNNWPLEVFYAIQYVFMCVASIQKKLQKSLLFFITYAFINRGDKFFWCISSTLLAKLSARLCFLIYILYSIDSKCNTPLGASRGTWGKSDPTVLVWVLKTLSFQQLTRPNATQIIKRIYSLYLSHNFFIYRSYFSL